MSKIEWTDRTWNPVTGCNKVSQGCKNCYAEVMHRRLMKLKPSKYSKPFLDGARVHHDELQKPLKWRKPSMVFVNSMSDLFHEYVPTGFIDDVFYVMSQCPQHTFQILTKRPERMLEVVPEINRWRFKGKPLPNVWLGVSCEDQETANKRIPVLLQVPAAVRFLSCEPLLGGIGILDALLSGQIHWVIAGGESGANARPMHPDWVRALRDQCRAAHAPFFFKQWGEYLHRDELSLGDFLYLGIREAQLPTLPSYFKVGKAYSANTLDGREWLEFPKPVTA